MSSLIVTGNQEKKSEVNHFTGPTNIHYHVNNLYQTPSQQPVQQTLQIAVPIPIFTLQQMSGKQVLRYASNGNQAPVSLQHRLTVAHSSDTMKIMDVRLDNLDGIHARLTLPVLPQLHPQHYGLAGLAVSLCVGMETVKPPSVFLISHDQRQTAALLLPSKEMVDNIPDIYVWQFVISLQTQRAMAARLFQALEGESRMLLIDIFKQMKIPTVSSYQLLWESVPVDIIRGMVLFIEQFLNFARDMNFEELHWHNGDAQFDAIIQAVILNRSLITLVPSSFQEWSQLMTQISAVRNLLAEAQLGYEDIWSQAVNKQDLLKMLPPMLKRVGMYPFHAEGHMAQRDKDLLELDLDDVDFGHVFLKREFKSVQRIYVLEKSLAKLLEDRIKAEVKGNEQ